MAPQEIQNKIESSQSNEIIKENKSPKEKLQKILESSTLKHETIENLKKILSLVDINELNDFIIWEPDLDDVINKWLDIDLSLSLEWIIDNFLMKFWETKTDKEVQAKIKKDKFENIKEIAGDNIKQRNIVDITEKEKKQNQSEWIRLLTKNDSKYRELFQRDANIIQILDDIKANEKDPTKVAELLNKFLSNKENATKFFDTIAKSWDKTLYEETIRSFKNLWVTIPAYISPIIYEVESKTVKIPPEIVAQLPWAKPENIEKRWDLLSYWDKTIDIKTGKAYISGTKWYAIETSMQVPNSLDIRVKYQKERLEILDEIKNNEKILNILDHKKDLKQELERLKSQKSTQWQSAQDLQIDIEVTQVEKELQKIDEKLKVIIPGYKEEQDGAFKSFLKEKIEEWKDKLTSLKEQFDADLKKLLWAGKDTIMKRDENVKKTIEFLDDLWLTNINQNDLQKIINRVNIIPQAFGFSKRIDLKAGFEWTPTDALQQKKELFKLFSKLYEKMDFTPPVNESIITWFPKDERLKNDTIFKQKLEDLNLTKGGSIQIETMMSLLWEKTQERERKYPWKPSSKPIHQEIPVETK